MEYVNDQNGRSCHQAATINDPNFRLPLKMISALQILIKPNVHCQAGAGACSA